MASTRATLNSSSNPTEKGSASEKAAACLLGVQLDDARLMKLVHDMLHPKSLPRGWTAEYIARTGEWFFKDQHGQLHRQHPLHGYYMGAIFMDQGGWAALKRAAAAQPPSSQQVRQMGAYLRIKESEGDYLWAVAEMALCAPLPPEWQEIRQGPHTTFRNCQTDVVQEEHPLDSYFRELLKRRRKEVKRSSPSQHHAQVQEVTEALRKASVLPEEECIIEDVLEEEMSLPGSCDGSEYNGVVSVTATVTRVQSRTSSRGSCRAALSSPGMSTHGVSPLSRTGSGAFEAWSVNGAAPRQKNTTSPPGTANRLLVRTIASLRPDYNMADGDGSMCSPRQPR